MGRKGHFARLLGSNAQKWPDEEAIVDSRGTRLTWQQAVQKMNRTALALVKDLKLNRDDCLIVQLPNMAEHILARIACEKAGIIVIAIQPTFRHTEVKWIAGQVKAAGIVIPRQYRDFDFYEMVKEIQPDLIINDRVGRGRQITRAERRENVDDTREFAGDFGTPEQTIPAGAMPGFDWETWPCQLTDRAVPELIYQS